VTEFIEGYHPKSLAELSREEATALAKSINKLHSVGVAHGDIRELNIIFKTNVVNGLHCYIIDFGNSNLVTSGTYPKLSVKSGVPPGIEKGDDENEYYWRLFGNDYRIENEEGDCYDDFLTDKLSRLPSRFQYLI
jgi:serine/threonine protein kinase